MAAAGEAIKAATGAQRMNYSILGNTDPALHAHLQPRFADEPDARRRMPVWTILGELPDRAFDAGRDAGLMADVRARLADRGRVA